MPLEIKSLREVKPDVRITPQYNLPGAASLGSYDQGFRQEMNQEYNRAENQGFGLSLANGFVSRGVSIATKFGSGLGSIGSIPEILTTDKGLEYLWENPISQAFDDMDDELRAALPVYGSKGYTGQGLFSKMGTEKFWLEDGFDGLAFLASAYLGGGTAKIGSSLLKSGAKGLLTKGGKDLAKKGLKKVGKTYLGKAAAKYGDDAITTAYNTITEASMEAGETNEQVKLALEQLRKDNPLYKDLTDEGIKLKAATAASQTFNLNAAALLVPNFIQAKWFNATTPDRFKMLRENIWANKGKADISKESKTQLKKEILKGFTSEGLWEENIQTAIQQYEKRMATSPDKEVKYSLDDTETYKQLAMQYARGLGGFAKSILPRFATNADEEESAASILLGGMIGGGMATMSTMRYNKALGQAATEEEARYKYLFETLGNAASELFRNEAGTIYKTKGKKKIKVEDKEVEVPDYELDDNGNLIKDERAIFNNFFNQMRDKKLFDAATAAAFNGDSVMDSYNREVALAAYAYKLFSREYSEAELNQFLDTIEDDNSEQAITLGVSSYLKDNKAAIKEYIKTLKSLSEQNPLSLDKQDDLSERSFNEFYNRTKFYLNVKRNAISKLNIADEQKSKLLEDLDSTEELLKSKSTIKDEYFKNVVPIRTLAAEYNSLYSTKNKTAEQEQRLSELSYQLNEDAHINRKYSILSNTDPNLTVGLPTSDLKNEPGSRFNHYAKLGRQQLVIQAAREELAAGTDPLNVLSSVAASAYYADDEFNDFINKEIFPLVESQEKANVAEEERLTTIASELEDALYEQTLDYISEETRDFLDTIQPNMSIEDVVDLHSTGDLTKGLFTQASAFATRRKTLDQIKETLNKVSKELASIDDRNKQLLTEKSEEYLQAEYFNNTIATVANNILDQFEAKPEEFFDLDLVNNTLKALGVAKKVFSSRSNQQLSSDIDTLIEELNKLIPQIVKNRESRRAKQVEISNRMSNAIIANIDSNLFKEVLGEDKFNNALQELEEDQEGLLSYIGVLGLVNLFREKATPEQLAKYTESLQLKIQDAGKQIYETINNTGTEVTRLNFIRGKVDKPAAYERSPDTTFFSALRALLFDYQTKEDSLAFKYLYDRDLSSLVINLDSDPYFPQKIKDAIRSIYVLHTDVQQSAKIINLILSTDIKFKDILSKFSLDNSSLKPTPQQVIVLADALMHYHSTKPANHVNGAGWMLVQGLPGSGKSFVIGKMLAGMLGNANIYAFSNTKFTSDNINNAIFGKANNSSLDNFLAMSIEEASKLDLIVIDEVFTLSDQRLTAVSNKLKEVFNTSKKTIKVIALGDSAQMSADDSNNHPLLNAFFNRMVNTIPLTVSYRTSVGAISTFLSNFQMNTKEVSNAFAQANTSVENAITDTSDITGIHSVDLETLLRLVAAPSSRTKVLIVASEEDVNGLRSKVSSNVPILTVTQAQGYQWDEVYTYLDPSKLGSDNINKNRAYYTAYSRAKSYLAVVHPSVNNIEIDPNLVNTYEESTKDLEANSIDFKFNKITGDKVHEILTGVRPVSKPAAKPTPVPQVTDVEEAFDSVPEEAEVQEVPEMENDTTEDEITPETIITSTEDNHALAYPTNYNLKNVDTTAPAHIIRSEKKGKVFYHVMAKAKGSNKYVEVGMLSDKDFNSNLGEFFKSIANTKQDIALPKDSVNKKAELAIDMNIYSLGTVAIQHVTPIRNKFHKEHKQSSSLLSNLIKDFVNSYFEKDEFDNQIYPQSMVVMDKATGKPKLDTNGNMILDHSKAWVVGDKVNWDIVKNHVTVKIFTRRNKPDGVLAGLPYLEIRDPRQAATTETSEAKNFYIPLQPRKLNSKNPIYQDITELFNTLVALQGKYPELQLGTEELYKAVSEHAKNNYSITDVGGPLAAMNNRYKVDKIGSDPDPELDGYLSKLVDLLYGPDYKTLFVSTEEDAKAMIGAVIEGKQITEYQKVGNNFMMRYASDTEGATSPMKVIALRSGKGRAQRALNTLAQANSHIRIGDVKAEIRITTKTDGGAKLTRAKNVLANTRFIDYQKMYQDHPHWEVNIGMFSSQDHLRNHLIKHGKVQASEFDKIVREYTTPPWNINMLAAIVLPINENGEHDTGDGYLRTPLNMDKINNLGNDLSDNANRNQLNDLLRSRYQSTQRTQVVISPTSQVSTNPNEFEDRDLKSELERLPNKEYTILKSLLINFGKDFKVQYNSLPEAGQGSRAGGFDNVKKVIYFNYPDYDSSALMHEALHANLNDAITQGKLDKQNGIDSKAARFFEVIDELYEKTKSDKNLHKHTQSTISQWSHYEFVANLDHQPFVNYLQSKKIAKQSMLSRLINAIVEYLGANANYFTVAAKAIEDFLTAESKVEEFTEVSTLKEQFIVLYNTAKELDADMSVFSDIYNGSTWTKEFEDLSNEDKINKLSSLLGISDGGNISYGLFSPPAVVNLGLQGTLLSTAGLDDVLKLLVRDSANELVNNIIASVVSYQIANLDSKILSNILSIDNEDTILEIMDVVFTKQDRKIIKSAYPDINDLNKLLLEAAIIIKRRESIINDLVLAADNFSIRRYELAFNYVLDKIESNAKVIDTLIKTKNELISEIFKNLDEDITESRNEVRRLITSAMVMLKTGNIAAANNILTKTLVEAQNRYAALSSMKVTNKNSGRYFFYDVLKDIYPKTKIQDNEDLEMYNSLLDNEDDISKTREDQEIEDGGISEHIKKYNKSQELTLSESIKDFLSLLRVESKRLNPSFVYVKTLQLIESIDTTSLDTVILEINEVIGDSGISEVDKVIYTNIINTITTARSERNPLTGKLLPTNIGIVSNTDDSGTVYYRIGITDNALGMTQSELESLGVLSKKFYSTKDMLKYLGDNISVSDFNALFKKAEAVNVMRELHNLMFSMKEAELMIGTRQVSSGLEVAYIVSKATGVSNAVRDTIVEALENLYENNKLNTIANSFKATYPQSYEIITKNVAGVTTEQLRTAIKDFFYVIGLPDVASNVVIKKIEADNFRESIKFLLQVTQEEVVHDIEPVEDEADIQKGSFQWFIKEYGGRLTDFAGIISRSSEFLRNPSVMTSTGEKYYKFHESSFFYDTLYNLIRMHQNPYFKGTTASGSKIRKVPSYLRTSTFKHNIFTTGLSSIRFLAEHEALKNLGNDSITPYTRESKWHYFHREFLLGFFDGIRQSKGKEFYLFTYTPSDKPKTPLAKVKLLPDYIAENAKYSDLDKALLAAFDYFIERRGVKLNIAYFNDSMAKDEYRNFKVIKQAESNLNKRLDNTNKELFLIEVNRLLAEEARLLAEELVNIEFSLDKNFSSTVASALIEGRSKLNNKYDVTKIVNENYSTKSYDSNGESSYNLTVDKLLPFVELYLKNHYVNNFFLHHFVAGDYAAYKGSSSEVVKRMAGVLAPGIRPLVDESIGMKPKFKVLVLQDSKQSVDSIKERLSTLFYKDVPKDSVKGREIEKELDELMSLFSAYDIADAQGFMLPSRKAELEKGFGRSWGMGNVHKPVHFQLMEHTVVKEDGPTYTITTPVYLKYSSIVLSDDLVNRFPQLKKLRTQLEKSGADELIMHTGVKTGIPVVTKADGTNLGKNFSYTFEEFLNMENPNFDDHMTSPILELDNEHYRLQHNPAGDPRKNVSIFTQLMYFINAYENTFDVARTNYSLVGELIKMGSEEFFDKLQTEADLKNYLLKKFKGPGAERALELLKSGVSINNPILENKAIISIISGLEAATVKIKFSGGKLVLQTAQGISKYQDPSTFDVTLPLNTELSYVRKNIGGKDVIVAETIVPSALLTDEQLAAVKSGKDLFLYSDMMGFRIPSSELHSAVALKVVGVYDNENTNVIIAPKELVGIHGSDGLKSLLLVTIIENFFNCKEVSL